jgi:hypothetical protein
MHGIEWVIASLPVFGFVALLAEIMTRHPHALLDILLDCEAFALAKEAPTVAEDPAPIGVALDA